MSYPLATARAIAEKIIADISPYCTRCDIAGSIRREKPEVKDIEIVCIPKFADVPGPVDLFGEKKLVANVLQQHLQAKDTVRWIKPGTSIIEDWPLKPDAKYWRGLMPNGIKIDIFLARPENYGMIYLMRTGSFEFNIAVFTHAKKIRRPAADGWLWVDRVRRDTPEEQDVFNWLGLRWVEPRERISDLAVRKSEFAEKGGLHLLPSTSTPDPKPAPDWNATAAASPFVVKQPVAGAPALPRHLTPDPQPPRRLGEYVDQRTGECYPVEVLEDNYFLPYLRFPGERAADWHREGFFSAKFLNA